MSAIEHLPEFDAIEDNGLLRFMTCGSVDDGKSTLIGRLLFDSRAILADTLHAIEKISTRRGLDTVDLSLLTDGLQAEREQGITIDVAYRYFSTGTRKYIIADAPGHEQYTRNMVTAASAADLAIILVDARRGVVTQTRRHSYLAHRLGVPHLVVAVNKMDLVGYDCAVFERICADYRAFADELGIRNVIFVPLSALNGDMVVERGARTDWYDGPTLLELLETSELTSDSIGKGFRFPVQFVCRPQQSANPDLHDYRGIMGRIESGSIAIGDEVIVLPSGRKSRIKGLELGRSTLTHAISGQSISILLDGNIDVSRGDMLVRPGPGESPRVVRQAEAQVCWLSEVPLDTRRKYLVRQTTRETKAVVSRIDHRLELSCLQRVAAESLEMNDIAMLDLRLAHPLVVDTYTGNRATGAFILIDEVTNNTVAAGMIL